MKEKQREVLIVDGYNVINAWEDLKAISQRDLEEARDRLIFLLSEYASWKDMETVVVFDAYNVKSSMEREISVGKLKVIYTKEKQTADSFIENFITQYPWKRHTVLQVVTDDMAEQQLVLGAGAARISTRELALRMQDSTNKIRKKTLPQGKPRNTLDKILDGEVLEKLDAMRKK